MSTENEIRKVEDAIDDLQLTTEIFSYIVISCTSVLSGSLGLIYANNIVSLILSTIGLSMGIIGVVINLQKYKVVRQSRLQRKQRNWF